MQCSPTCPILSASIMRLLELLQHCCSYPAVAMVNTNMVANRGISSLHTNHSNISNRDSKASVFCNRSILQSTHRLGSLQASRLSTLNSY